MNEFLIKPTIHFGNGALDKLGDTGWAARIDRYGSSDG